MLQLFKHGPEIPLEVCTALEEEKLVLFCGAGVSVYSGLPLFAGLVDEVYKRTAEVQNAPEERAVHDKQYDKVLGLLEERLVKGAVRAAVRKVLTAPAPGPLSTHEDLLELSRIRGGYRLVTTNFDRRFLEAGGLNETQVWRAPALTLPKDYSWRTVVHLHGVISDDDPNGADLVLTAADFGQAYLAEGWAARFVVELFRQFTVLFIGYGVNDPVIGYLINALAAERHRGQSFRTAFAFAPHGRGGEQHSRESAEKEWRAKGIEPVAYLDRAYHMLLYRSLHGWAELKRGGLTCRVQLASRESRRSAKVAPDSPRSKRLVWAFLEESGAVARAFASADPPPPLKWLDTLEHATFTDPVSGIEACTLLSLPAAIPVGDGRREYKPQVALVGSPAATAWPLRQPTRGIARWLARSCHEPELLRWVLTRGAPLHPEFADLLARELERPSPVVPTAIRQVWEALLNRGVRRLLARGSAWFEVVQVRPSDDLTDLTTKRRILDALRLVPNLRPASSFPGDRVPAEATELTRSDLVRVELRFAEEFAESTLIEAIRKHRDFAGFLVAAVDDLTSLLKDGLEVLELFGAASSTDDPSLSELPSISPHDQNRDLHEWVHFIHLLREAIEVTTATDLDAAEVQVRRWCAIRYPVFERLSLHAATLSPAFGPFALEVLRRDDRHVLWSIWHQREVMRFLRLGAGALDAASQGTLVRAILDGPPRSIFRADLTDAELEAAVARRVWHRLVKLAEGGALELSEGQERLRTLSESLSPLPAQGELDEFPMLMGVARWGDGDSGWISSAVTRRASELVSQVLDRAQSQMLEYGELRALSGTRPVVAIRCAEALFERGQLSAEAANDLFLGFEQISKPVALRRVACAARQLIRGLCRAEPPLATWGIGNFFEHLGKHVPLRERGIAESTELWRLVWDAAGIEPKEEHGDALTTAINHPAGFLTQMLLRDISQASQEAAAAGPGDALLELLGLVLVGDRQAGRLGRVILASQLLFVYSIAKAEATAHLIPRFDWSACDEAAGLWTGFFYAPRFSADLFGLLRPAFLQTFDHLKDLPEEIQRVAGELLAAVAVNLGSALSAQEHAAALRKSNEHVLDGALGAFIQLIKADPARAGDLWDTAIAPWFAGAWPRGNSKQSPRLSERMAELATTSVAAFPATVDTIHPFLVPTAPIFVLQRLCDPPSDLAAQFPQAALKLLDALVADKSTWSDVKGLAHTLEKIRSGWPGATGDERYKRLAALAERLGRP